MPGLFCGGFGGVDGSRRMLGRGVEGGELQGTVSQVDHVMPDTAGNEYCVTDSEGVTDVRIALSRSHSYQSPAFFHPEQLVSIRMEFQTDLTPGRNLHDGEL